MKWFVSYILFFCLYLHLLQAMKALRTGKQGRIDPEDVEFVVRHDAKKLNRIHAMFGFNNMKARHTAEDEMDASAIAILSERYAPPK